MKHRLIGTSAIAVGTILAALTWAWAGTVNSPQTFHNPTRVSVQRNRPPIPTTTKAFNWLQPFANSQHTGYNPVETALTRSNVSMLKEAWQSSPISPSTYGSMVTDGGVVYVGGGGSSGYGDVYAFDANTGAQKWSFFTLFPNAYTPAISGALIYVDCYTSSSAGSQGLCALSRSTGKLQWGYNYNCQCTHYSSIFSAAAVSGTTVVFDYYFGDECFCVAALNASTGTFLWKATAGTGSSNNLASSTPAIDKGNVFVATNSGICSYQLANGTLNWCDSRNFPTLRGAVAASKGVVYASYVGTSSSNGDVIFAENESNGSQLWFYQEPCYACLAGDNDPPAIAKGTVYASGNSGGYLYAFNAKSGKPLWSTNGGVVLNFTAPSIANGVVYVGCDSGNNNFCAHNSATGKLLASIGPTGAKYQGSPAIANGKVYVQSPSSLLMFDL